MIGIFVLGIPAVESKTNFAEQLTLLFKYYTIYELVPEWQLSPNDYSLQAFCYINFNIEPLKSSTLNL